MHLYETHLMKIYFCMNHMWNMNICKNIKKYMFIEHIWKLHICKTHLEYKTNQKNIITYYVNKSPQILGYLQAHLQLQNDRTEENFEVSFGTCSEKSRNGDTLGPVELIVWPEKGNQGDWREQDG